MWTDISKEEKEIIQWISGSVHVCMWMCVWVHHMVWWNRAFGLPEERNVSLAEKCPVLLLQHSRAKTERVSNFFILLSVIPPNGIKQSPLANKVGGNPTDFVDLGKIIKNKIPTMLV